MNGSDNGLQGVPVGLSVILRQGSRASAALRCVDIERKALVDSPGQSGGFSSDLKVSTRLPPWHTSIDPLAADDRAA